MSYDDEDPHYPDDDWADGDYDDDEDAWMDDCGLDPSSGQCMQAGTEHCDWRCPASSSASFAGSRKWYEARGKRPPWDDYLYEPGLRWPRRWRYQVSPPAQEGER